MEKKDKKYSSLDEELKKLLDLDNDARNFSISDVRSNPDRALDIIKLQLAEIDRLRREVYQLVSIPPAEQVAYLKQILEKDAEIERLDGIVKKVVKWYNRNYYEHVHVHECLEFMKIFGNESKDPSKISFEKKDGKDVR